MLSSRRKAAHISLIRMYSLHALTYSTTVRSAGHGVVLKLELDIEDIGIELDFAVEFVADAPPVRSWP